MSTAKKILDKAVRKVKDRLDKDSFNSNSIEREFKGKDVTKTSTPQTRVFYPGRDVRAGDLLDKSLKIMYKEREEREKKKKIKWGLR
jgi:hypothetical protein